MPLPFLRHGSGADSPGGYCGGHTAFRSRNADYGMRFRADQDNAADGRTYDIQGPYVLFPAVQTPLGVHQPRSVSLLDNAKAWTISSGKVTDVSANKMFKGLGRMLIGCLEGKVVNDGKSFRIEISESQDHWAVKLLPQKNDVKQMWDSIVLHFVPSLNAVVKVEMNEKSGDATVVELKNMKVNCSIDDKEFKAEL